MRKNIVILCLLFTCLIAISQVCFAKGKSKAAKSGQLTEVSLRLKWHHQSQFAGFYYADKAGYYKQAGLKVNINPGGLDYPTISMVARGEDDFGVSSPDQLLLAREKGIPVVALAVIYQQTPAVIMSLRESNITKLSDLLGKKIGIKYGKDDELIYRAELRAANIDAKKIVEIPVKYDLALLLNKNIDAILAYSTAEVQEVLALGKEVNLIYPADYGINFYSDTLFTTEKMIKERPQLVRKFVQASLKGWRAVLNDQQKAVDYSFIYMMYNETMPREVETAKFVASLPLIKVGNLPVGAMQKSTWEAMQKQLLRFGFMRHAIDVNQVFTTRFLK